ncbi:MAG: hypothetical protein WBK77_00710 [Alphaproteobacteria bacterium]
MSAIGQALAKLERAIGKLEGAAVGVESALAGQQRDMFGSPIKKNGAGAGMQGALFAKRLDHAIEKIDTLLKE